MNRKIRLYFNGNTDFIDLNVPYSIKVVTNQNKKSKIISIQRFVGNKSSHDADIDIGSYLQNLYKKYISSENLYKIEYYVDNILFMSMIINNSTIKTYRVNDTVQYYNDEDIVVIEEIEIYTEGV